MAICICSRFSQAVAFPSPSYSNGKREVLMPTAQFFPYGSQFCFPVCSVEARVNAECLPSSLSTLFWYGVSLAGSRGLSLIPPGIGLQMSVAGLDVSLLWVAVLTGAT